MQFLKLLFWCLLAFVAAVFTFGNWTSVQIHLWSGLVADVNLPLLLLLTFLAGLLPTLLFHHTVRWRMRSRLTGAERAIADLRGALGGAPASGPVVVESMPPPPPPVLLADAPAPMPPGAA